MTLDELLQQKLTEWHPPPGRHSLTVDDPACGWSVTLTADRRDVLGCLVWELAARRSTPAGGSLGAWAERLAERATGLVERLKVHEVDTLRNEAQLRSEAPSRRGVDLFYYELLLQGTSTATLRRYQASHEPAEPREQVAYAVTYEVLGNLVRNLVAG